MRKKTKTLLELAANGLGLVKELLHRKSRVIVWGFLVWVAGKLLMMCVVGSRYGFLPAILR